MDAMYPTAAQGLRCGGISLDIDTAFTMQYQEKKGFIAMCLDANMVETEPSGLVEKTTWFGTRRLMREQQNTK